MRRSSRAVVKPRVPACVVELQRRLYDPQGRWSESELAAARALVERERDEPQQSLRLEVPRA
jgi:hypothetical protein